MQKLKLATSIFISTALLVVNSPKHWQILRTVLLEMKESVIRPKAGQAKENRLLHIGTS